MTPTTPTTLTTPTSIERDGSLAIYRLDELHLERTIDCIVEIWTEDNRIARALGVTGDEYRPLAEHLAREAVEMRLGLVLVDETDDRVLGFHLSRDLVDEMSPGRDARSDHDPTPSSSLEIWSDMVRRLEQQYVAEFRQAHGRDPERGEVLYFNIGGIVPALRRKGWIIRMGGAATREHAVARGYRHIVAIATHPDSVVMIQRPPFRTVCEFEFAQADDPRWHAVTEPRTAILGELDLTSLWQPFWKPPHEPETTSGHDEEPSLLDPTDWQELRRQCHEMLDRGLDRLERIRDHRVWTPVPDHVATELASPPPGPPRDTREVCDDLTRLILPYPTGNIHPRFFGWVHGSGTASAVIPAIAGALMNSNVGGRDHGAIYVERAVIEWFRRLFDFPENASGLITTGTSMANLIGLAVARHRADRELRGKGLSAVPVERRLVGYTSTESHYSVAKAFELLGLGSEALRRLPTDPEYRLDCAALRRAIADDRRAGLSPFCIIAGAGTVKTGSIDDLDAIADVARDEDLWLHVDGAFGAMIVLHDELKPRLRGIERANSITFDFHKWMHVRYDAGCVLVRDREVHLDAFAARPDYLESKRAGLAGGSPWPCDFGPELSRGFRALDVWFTVQEHGTERLGQAIADNCAQAGYLARVIDAHPCLERMAPVSLAIVCFRYAMGSAGAAAAPAAAGGAAHLDQLNSDIVVALHQRGIAAPSTTRLRGALAIRVNITNHRTRRRDLDELVQAVVTIGRELNVSPRGVA